MIMNEKNKAELRWLMGLVTFLFFLFPILGSDEFSIFYTWLLTLVILCYSVFIISSKYFFSIHIHKAF